MSRAGRPSSDPGVTPGFDLADDDRVIGAFVDEARVAPVSPFHTARALHALEAALDADAAARARFAPLRIGAVALVAGFVGAASVVVLLQPSSSASSSSSAGSPPVAVAPAPSAPPASALAVSAEDDVGDGVSAAAAVDVAAALAPPAPRLAVSPAKRLRAAPEVKAAPRAHRSWREESETLVADGDGVGAARVIVKALAHDDTAAPALALVAGRFPDALDAVDAELAQLKSAEAMRVRCEQRLLRKRDESAVEACRAFGLEHPEHPGARTLAFAAGRLAEDEVGDLAAAEEAYSRALLLSPFVGVTGTDALLARARVRAARDDLDDARADLRLYLHNEPQGRDDPAVAALAARLGL